MIILSSGMPRSASTLLFNIIREVLISRYGKETVVSMWREFPTPFEDARKIYVVKTHEFHKDQIDRSDFIFYCYRDIRTAMVSNFRKFGEKPNIEWARKYINEWRKGRAYADQTWRYEALVTYSDIVIRDISVLLCVPVDTVMIQGALASYAPPLPGASPDPVTMLHSGHRTNTSDDEWRQVLDGGLQRQLRIEFDWWFRLCGYPLE